MKKLKQIDPKKTRAQFKELLTYSKGFKLSILIIIIGSSLSSLLSIWVALITKDIIDFSTSQNFTGAIKYIYLFIILLLIRILLSKFNGIFNLKIKNDMMNKHQYNLLDAYYSID